jgi:hypothetical protein
MRSSRPPSSSIPAPQQVDLGSRCARRSLCRVRLFWMMRTKSVRKIASRETTNVRKLKGNGSMAEPGVPGDPRREPDNVGPANHPETAFRAMASEKRSAGVCRARSAASSWAIASTFRARSGEAGARPFGDPFGGVGIGACGWRRRVPACASRWSLPFSARWSRVSGSLRASRESDRPGGRSPSASGPSGTP